MSGIGGRACVAAAAVAVALGGCSAVQSSYVKAGYDATAADATKRIAIVAYATPEHPGVDTLFRSVVADRVDLKMNYLVYRSDVIAGPWSEACVVPSTAASTNAEPESTAASAGRVLDGVLSIRAVEISVTDEVDLHLIGELHRCRDGELLWRADGSEGNAAADEDLAALTQSYIDNLGPGIEPYAAPAFLVLRDMLETLPDPVLNDDEVMEKIELGRRFAGPAPTAARADRLR